MAAGRGEVAGASARPLAFHCAAVTFFSRVLAKSLLLIQSKWGTEK